MTGWRLGWMVVPEYALEAMDDLATNFFLCAHTPTQHAALACFTPETLAVCEERRQELLERRRIVVDGLAEIGLPLEVEPNGAFYAYFNISDTGLDAWTFCERALKEAHIALTPGRDFGEATADTHVRLSYAASREALREGLKRLGVRLMQYLKEDGTIRKAGVEAVLEAVQKAMKLAEEYEITQLLVLATSALREAPNGGKILRRIEETIGQPVTVLSGVDEARLTFLAARRWYGWDAGRLLVLDIGGGSLEVAMGSDEDPTVALSVPAGAGRVTREFLPENGVADAQELEKARKQIRRILDPMVEAFPKSKHPMHASAVAW